MSGTNTPTPIPVALQIAPAGSTFTQPVGSVGFQVAVTGTDGTTPTAVSDTPTVASVSALTGVAGEGLTYAGQITAVSAGTANITIAADGVANTIYAVAVSLLPDESLTVTLGTIVAPSA